VKVPIFKTGVEKAVRSLLDNGAQVQAPAVAKYVDRFRRSHPDESPAQIIERLEKLYLTTVTGSGTAVGATAAVPAVGTLAAIAAASAETTFFLEASAVLTLAVAAVHGIAPDDAERRRALVLAVVLGGRIPGITSLNEALMKRFVLRFLAERSPLMFGKVLPAGIGAAIGGFGNRALGKRTIANAHRAFGPAPLAWPAPLIIDADPLPTLDNRRKP
jgi:PPE-repeat protein